MPSLISSLRRARIVLALSLGLLAVGLFACNEAATTLRKSTYPPGFRYISPEQIQGTMWQLASLTDRLDRLTDDPARLDANRDEIEQVLRALESAADELKKEGVPANHPLIHANLDAYRGDVRAALRSVEREPPSYLRAAALPGACVYCHAN